MSDKEEPGTSSVPPSADEALSPPQPKIGRPPALKAEEIYGGKAPRLKDLDAEIEKELQEALGGLSAQEMLGEPNRGSRKPPTPEPGRKIGKVLRVHGADVFIDVPGGRSQGVMPLDQFPDGPPAIGTEVEVHIEGYDNADGLVLLSRQGATIAVDWSSVAPNMIVEARVTGTNKGGLEVEVNGIRGFMPISQIDLYRVETPDEYVNQRLRCLVTDVSPEDRNLVVSRRAILEREREEAREKLWQELAEGQVRDGMVRSVRDFGAFVDIGGADGLLHVSEMSWSRVEDATTVVQPGQAIKVIVLKIDHEKRKISLGLKQLLPSPWDNIETKYPAGTTVNGKITRLADFGAFMELEPGVEGLIHISELSPQRVHRVKDIVQPGQEVQVQVLKIDPAQRRISLSLKAALPKPEVAPVEEDTEEPAGEVKPLRPRTTPLRGGLGRQ